MPLFARYEPHPGRPRAPRADVTVRDAAVADLQRLAEIACTRHGGTLDEARARFARELERLAKSRRRRLWVAELDGRVAGFARLHEFRPRSDAPANVAPAGWYLSGVVVDPALRRRGVGSALTRARLDFVAERADTAYYVVNAQNLASIDLHARFGFREVTRDFVFPGVTFSGGVGALFCAELSSSPESSRSP